MGFCQIIGWPSNQVQNGLSRGFHWLGGFAGKRPFIMILIGIVIAIICGIGITMLEEDDDVFYMPSSRSNKDERLIKDTFGEVQQEQSSRLIVIASDNILQSQALATVYDIHLQVLNDIRTESGITYQNVCIKQGDTQQCVEDSFFAVLGLSNRDEVLSANAYDLLTDTAVQALGGVIYDNGTVIAAKSLQLVYYEQDKGKTYQWEEAYIQYFKDNQQQIVANSIDIEEINFNNMWGADYETDRIVSQEQPLIFAAFGLILIYMCIILGGRPFVRSRFLLGLSCLLTVILSFVFSLGLCGYFGVKFTIISILAGFVLLGVGVDDMIIIVDALKRTDPMLGIPEAIAEAMKEAGHAITITSFTSFVAFMIASSIDFLAIRYFCILAGLGILGVYIMQITFFLGVLVLDERRMRANRVDCLPCVKLPTSDSNVQTYQVSSKNDSKGTSTSSQMEVNPSTQEMIRDAKSDTLPPDADPTEGKNYPPSVVRYFLVKILSPAIAHTWFRALLILLFMGLLGGMIYSTSQLSSDTDTTDLYSDDSYLKPYFRNLKDYYSYASVPCQLLVFGVQPFDVTVRSEFEGVRDQLLNFEFMSGPVSYWVDDITLWGQTQGTTEIPQDYQTGILYFENFTQAQPFNASLPDGTNKEVFPVTYENDIVPYKDLYATRMFMYYGQSSASQPNIDNLKDVRGVLDEQGDTDGVLYVVWEENFEWHDRDAKMVISMVQNLVYASLGVLASLLIFVHPVTALFVGAIVVCVDICLLGFMNLWGLKLDVASFICVAMALGLAVDYVVHIATFFVACGGTPYQRLLLTYSDMGTSVFNGGFSTFLGVIVLSLAQSNGFRTFFKVMFGVVVFGILFGLIFVPVVLYQFYSCGNCGQSHPPHQHTQKISPSKKDLQSVELQNQN